MIENMGRRQEDRCIVTVRAVVHGPDEQRFEGRLRNISPTGACVEHNGNLLPGDEIGLQMENPIPQSARVIWASERLAGVSFAEQGQRSKPDAAAARVERRALGFALASVAAIALSIYSAQAWLLHHSLL